MTNEVERALRKSAESEDSRVRAIAGSSPTVPTDVIYSLSTDRSIAVRIAVSKNALKASAELLSFMARDPDPEVVENVALHHLTDPSTLEFLSHHTDAIVRANTASNENTPHSALTRLSRDDCSGVRLQVLLNPESSDELIASFAPTDEDCLVRLELLELPQSKRILTLLLTQQGIDVDGLPEEWRNKLLDTVVDFSCDCDYHSTPTYTELTPQQFITGSVPHF